MALLPLPLSFLSPSHPPSVAIAPRSFPRLWQKHRVLHHRSYGGIGFSQPFGLLEKRSVVVWASSEIDGTDANGPEAETSEGSEKSVSVENLPLESKQQMILEQRLKMKLAKKIRLRRKRLLRKRRMRKKGRWPPSKMKKNKNV